jgi:hypothetical protein
MPAAASVPLNAGHPAWPPEYSFGGLQATAAASKGRLIGEGAGGGKVGETGGWYSQCRASAYLNVRSIGSLCTRNYGAKTTYIAKWVDALIAKSFNAEPYVEESLAKYVIVPLRSITTLS